MQLNAEQVRAVSHYEGTCIVTACPGSGKTHVLASRVVYLIKNKNVNPRNILCLTFTNKAANEMKERVKSAFFDDPEIDPSLVWISTFHRLCLAILRKHGHMLGLPSNFTIYSSKDQEELVAKVARMNDCDASREAVKSLTKIVNDFRENALDVEKYCEELNPIESQIVKEYLETLDKSHVIDFSGMLYKAWLLLKQHPDVAAALTKRFKYVLVDEMQDTNRIQYNIIKCIASHQNLFVVGDVQQSIYSFRGAKPENLEKLRTDFDKVSEVVLLRNYRSTTQILAMAETLIHNNHDAHSVRLISEKGSGLDPCVVSCMNPEEEAARIAHKIIEMKNLGYPWSDFAVLYRMNSMSRSPEVVFHSLDIPYRLVGGFSFFDRTEVKTTLSYLSLLVNSSDTVAFTRAVSSPRRGIGDSLLGKLERAAQESGIPILDICQMEEHIDKFPIKAKSNLLQFSKLVYKYRNQLETGKALYEVADGLIKESGYYNVLQKSALADYKSNQPRLENVQELVVGVREFEEQNPQSRLEDYLQSVLLMSDLRDQKEDENAVTLLTMHSAKGLEWPCVFIIGVEEGSVPHYRAVQEGSIEEERRLLYVALTRAERFLQISYCRSRRNRLLKGSSFLDEIH